jgi:carbohydrate diacid regulator
MTAVNAHELLQQLVERAHYTFNTDVELEDASGVVVARPNGVEEDRSLNRWVSVPVNVLGHAGRLNIRQPDTESPSQQLVESVVELLVNQVALVDSLPHQHELKHQFINRLLHHQEASADDDLIREGQILGMDLTRPRAVLLIDASAYIGRPVELHSWQSSMQGDWLRAESLIREIVRFLSLPSDAICGYLGQGEIGVLKATSSQDLRPWLRQEDQFEELPNSWSDLGALKAAAAALRDTLATSYGEEIMLGVGRYHSGIRGLSRSYQDAQTALGIGRRLGRDGGVYCLDQLGLAALVGIPDEETRVSLARHLLGPLEAEPELTHTLKSFFDENCSVVSAAHRLFIHRNTLNYRLDKIESLTGLDPRRFDEATSLRYAFVVGQLAGIEFLCR